MSLTNKDLLSPSELNDFATDFLGLNESDSDLFYESYYDMDTETNFNDEVRAYDEALSPSEWKSLGM